MLNAMPEMYDNLRCPTCLKMLKLWRKEEETGRRRKTNYMTFNCSSSTCPQGANASINNEGFNMFMCFPCDYTLCLTCAHQVMNHQVRGVKKV